MAATGIVFGVGAAVGWGIADYGTALAARRGGAFAVLLTAHVAAISLMTVFMLAVLGPPSISTTEWLYCIALGPLSVATYLSLFRALEAGPLAIVSPVVAGWAMVTVLLALVLLAEPLTVSERIGCGSILLGVLLASIRPGEIGEARIGVGAVFAIGAMLGLGSYNFLVGSLAREIGWFFPVYLSRIAGVALMIGIASLRREWPWRRLDRRALLLAIFVSGLFGTLGILSFNRGAELGFISLTSAAASIYPLIPIALGLIVLRERIRFSQSAGLVLILVGLLAFSVLA